MINKYPYSQFTGTIQVMKAIGSHIVLTFCQTEGQLFSIILSRSPNTLTADVSYYNLFLVQISNDENLILKILFLHPYIGYSKCS